MLRGGREDSARRKVIMQHFRGAHATGLARAGNETRGPCSLVRILAGGHAMPSPGERKPRAEGGEARAGQGLFFRCCNGGRYREKATRPPEPPRAPEDRNSRPFERRETPLRVRSTAPSAFREEIAFDEIDSRAGRLEDEAAGLRAEHRRALFELFDATTLKPLHFIFFFNSPPARALRPSRNSLELRELRDSPRWGA